MTTTTPPRPRQVTWAAWVVMVGSGLVIVSTFEAISGIRSIESREAIEDALSEAPAGGAGLTVEQVTQGLQALGVLGGAAAGAAAILGGYVLQRHRGARIGLSVLAPIIFVSGLVSGGIASAFVAVAVTLLWSQPARDWYDGRTPPKAPEAERRSDPHAAAEAPPSGPRAMTGFGSAPSTTRPTQESGVAAGPQPGEQPGGHPPAPTRRPDAVVWAAILTWIFAGFALISAIAAALLVGVVPGGLDELRASPGLEETGLSDSELITLTWITCGVIATWSTAACVLAGLVLRRSPVARTALLVSAFLAAALCLFGLITNPLLLVPGAGAVATASLLRRPDVRAWVGRTR